MPTPDTEDLTAKAYRSLRRMIVAGRMQPQQRLSHRTISKDLGIGRSPVRDALLQLEAEGLIEYRPNSGIYLREPTPQELECIYELRLVNEPYAAEKAAERATDGQLATLQRTCEEMASLARRSDLTSWFTKADNRRRFCRLDIEFHTTVMEASGNPVAVKLFANAQLPAFTFAWGLGYGRPEWFAEIIDRTAAGHQLVSKAIRCRDPQAARAAMVEHISWARVEIPRTAATAARAPESRDRGCRAGRRGRGP